MGASLWSKKLSKALMLIVLAEMVSLESLHAVDYGSVNIRLKCFAEPNTARRAAYTWRDYKAADFNMDDLSWSCSPEPYVSLVLHMVPTQPGGLRSLTKKVTVKDEHWHVKCCTGEPILRLAKIQEVLDSSIIFRSPEEGERCWIFGNSQEGNKSKCAAFQDGKVSYEDCETAMSCCCIASYSWW
ncbi:uncharacterized protein LOC124777649 [Schistocerca piceifrons]|uniref:uncharacterized protein LOC124777649 n=1 Tax=Schistocerca piceifrons TaxID=274613 RepID=UPI001F5F9CD3|nr:uncharacterized protein LOC124777649 [Schistocerca piceifrons]